MGKGKGPYNFTEEEVGLLTACVGHDINDNTTLFPRRLFCFSSLVILDVACCYLWLFSLYINIKIGKNRY